LDTIRQTVCDELERVREPFLVRRDALGPFVRFVLRVVRIDGKVKNLLDVLEDLVPDAVVVLEVIDPVGDVLRVERVLESHLA